MVYLYCKCNTKEVTMDAAVKKRQPIALRLPSKDLETVESYAVQNSISKTDAFLYYLRKGFESEHETTNTARLCAIERKIDALSRALAVQETPVSLDMKEAIAKEAAKFSAIEKVILFGSFATGHATEESDIDLRLVIDRSETFSLFDLARFQKAIRQETGHEVDAITADYIPNKNLAAAINREGVTIYERQRK